MNQKVKPGDIDRSHKLKNPKGLKMLKTDPL